MRGWSVLVLAVLDLSPQYSLPAVSSSLIRQEQCIENIKLLLHNQDQDDILMSEHFGLFICISTCSRMICAAGGKYGNN